MEFFNFTSTSDGPDLTGSLNLGVLISLSEKGECSSNCPNLFRYLSGVSIAENDSKTKASNFLVTLI